MQVRNEQYLRNLDKKLQKFLEYFNKESNDELKQEFEKILDDILNVINKLEKYDDDKSYNIEIDEEVDEIRKLENMIQNLRDKLHKFSDLNCIVSDLEYFLGGCVTRDRFDEKFNRGNFYHVATFQAKLVGELVNSIKSDLNVSLYKFDGKAFCEFLSKVLNTTPERIEKLFADDLNDYIKESYQSIASSLKDIKRVENRYNANVNCFNKTGKYIKDYDTKKCDFKIEKCFNYDTLEDEISELYHSSDEKFWGFSEAHELAKAYGLYNDDVFENVSMFNPQNKSVFEGKNYYYAIFEGKNYYYAIFSNPNPDKNWNEKLDNIMKLKKYYDENQDKQELAVETYLMYKEKGTLKVDVNSKRLLEMLIEINEYLSKGFKQGDFSKLEDIPQSFIDHLNEKYGSSDIGSMPSGNFVDAEENVKSNNRSM